MNIILELVETGASYIEYAVLFKLFAELLHKYQRETKVISENWLILLGVILIRLANQHVLVSYFTAIFFVLFTAVSAKFIYKVSIITIMSISSFYVVCVCCLDLAVVSSLSAIWNGNETIIALLSNSGFPRLLMIILNKGLWVAIYFFIRKYLYVFAEKIQYSHWLLVVSVVGFFSSTYLIEQTCLAFNNTLASIWLLIINVLAFVVFAIYYYLEKKQEKLKMDFIKEQNTLLEDNYKTINDIYTNNAKLFHDMNNHLEVLYQLLDEGATEDAKGYIKEISKPIRCLEKDIWTGVDVIDVVINNKMEKMKQRGIEFEINVEFPNNSNIIPSDMCVILANLLDNAIEATEKVNEHKKISLKIRKIKQFVIISINNPCIDANRATIETTKENRYLHGWGIQNVKEVVEHYNGRFDWVCEDNIFSVTVLLFYEKISQI